MSTILDLNDNCITLTGLFNKITQAFVNDATATVTIINATAGDGSDYQAKDEQVYIAPRKLSGF